jgi:hypothetical protein
MRPLYERWLAARLEQRRVLAPLGRFINDQWIEVLTPKTFNKAAFL